MKAIVYTRGDGGVSVCYPVISQDDEEGFSEQHAIDRALGKDIPIDAVSPTVVDLEAIPQDQTFSDAWQQSGGAIVHNMEKCRAILRDRMRFSRAPKLAVLDIEYQRADEVGDVARKQAIAAKKQKLRDVTKLPEIDAATTLEALKAVWPQDVLGSVS
ncbi:hypothetical protein [Bradyrhizobium australafricanum]|uniref:hypothetical protein n=1 Tax=Bradyrhizobium australafricanum TaxID=2821406 RepID=UPI001CE246FC|nr:hypothetical protein [Bradyrhizobium australafricanum]